MAKYTNRGDLLIDAGESIKMQINSGMTNPEGKCNGIIEYLNNAQFFHGDWEFPLDVVEGRPVFIRDRMYHSPFNDGNYYAFIFDKGHKNGGGVTPIKECTWNPPKPATVIVELLREDVEWVDCKISYSFKELCEANNRIREACRKALEK